MAGTASTDWMTVRTVLCQRIGGEAHLLERRSYPAEHLPDLLGYQVLARKCSRDIECNLVGIPCKWAFTNPECDGLDLS